MTVVGLNVDQKPFADWADRPQFWVRVLDLRQPAAADRGRLTGPGGQLYQSGVTDLATLLHQTLEQIPAASR